MKNVLAFLLLVSVITSSCRKKETTELELDRNWKFAIGDSLAYRVPGFDDQHWTDIGRPKMFNELGLKHYDGSAWYRCRVVIPSAIKSLKGIKKLEFYFGAIDDYDQFYLNGKLIGCNNISGDTTFKPPLTQSSVIRKYEVAIDDTLINWDQENVIAIRVFDDLGDGGLTTIPRIMASESELTKRYDFGKYWKFIKGDSLFYAHLIPVPDKMDSIAVGKPWETEGLSNYDGFGWYFKRFRLPPDWRRKSGVSTHAVLQFDFGRIDDFDQVFLNGHLLGENGENRRVGRTAGNIVVNKSGLAGLQRLYNIGATDQRLNWEGDNVIAVRVFDSGGDGGIMNAPYVSMTSSNIAVDLTKLYKVNETGKLDTCAIIENLDLQGKFNAVVRCKAVDQDNKILTDFSRNLTISPGGSWKLPVSIPFTKNRVKLIFEIVNYDQSSIFFSELNLPFVLLKG